VSDEQQLAERVDDLRLIDARELARRAGGSPSRWRALARANLCPHVYLGRQLRFSPAAVASWIARGGQPLDGGWRREAKAPTESGAASNGDTPTRRGRRRLVGTDAFEGVGRS